ncbi:hypothetical protein TNCV_4041911 [Trichonephila clavipes]|nr:hypothetical protein TNCV_4041911 [Trichonephila clavipes]
MAACIRHRHTGPSSSLMVWGAIEYMFRSPLVPIDGPLDPACYISGVLQFVVLPFIRSLRTIRFSRMMHVRMLPVLYGPSLTWKMLSCFSSLLIHQISRQ